MTLRLPAFFLPIFLSIFFSFVCSCLLFQDLNSKTNSNKGLNSGKPVCGIHLIRPQGLNSGAIFSPFFTDNRIISPCCTKLAIQYRYSQTRSKEEIAQNLFGASRIDVQGSLVKNRSNSAFVGDWLGLDPLYSGVLEFSPRIKQHQVDISAKIYLSNFCDKNNWFGISTTIASSEFNLHTNISEETIENETDADFLPGYPGYMGVNPVLLAASLKDVLEGEFLFGDMKNSWKSGKILMPGKNKKDTKFANVDLLFGRDFVNCDSGYFTGFLKISAPTGTKLDRKYFKYVFNPIIGNGGYWGLGLGINGERNLLRYGDCCLTVGFVANLMHLLENNQYRHFDFRKRGALSKYMLLKEISSDGTNPTDYKENLINAVDYNLLRVKSSFDFILDASFRLNYHGCRYKTTFGYNFYIRSKEEVKYSEGERNRSFGIKGNAGTHTLCIESSDKILSAERYNGTKTDSPGSTSTSVTRESASEVDKVEGENDTCTVNEQNGFVFLWDKSESEAIEGIEDAFPVSAPAVSLKINSDIDIKPIKKQVIHTIFASVDYYFDDCCWQPSLGVYAEYNFSSKGCYRMPTPAQWSLGVRGELSF